MNETAALTEATYYILLSLWTPQHGYGIMQRAEELSEGRVRLAAGTLYGALSQLTTKGWIILLPVDGEYNVCFYTQTGLYQCLGRIIDRYKSDNVFVLVMELTTAYKTVQSATYQYIPALLISGVIYFTLTFTLSRLLNVFERKLKSNDR